ncbi:MAG: GIY-YIG nuclease family protein [Patescibacteria group bacterium]
MKFFIYWLISEDYTKTYVGFSDNILRRISEHKKGLVKTTIHFNKFRCFKLETADTIFDARKREKYWKSRAGRKKLQQYFYKITLASSSNG